MKIMIVDDHWKMRNLIRELLAKTGVETRECVSGNDALRIAREFQPDWVIMDVHLPGVSGLEATEIIRKEVPGARIVVVSTDDRSYLREAAQTAGAHEFLCKHDLARLPRMIFGPGSPPAA